MEPLDPYRPPRAIDEAAPARSSGKLYSPGQVTAATFLGSPIAGALLMATNYRAFGNERARSTTLLLGALGTLAVMALAFLLPAKFPDSILGLISTLAMRTIADRQQGPAFATHLGSGGPRHSHWRVVGIALGCMFGVLLLAMLFLMAWQIAQ